MQVIRAGWNNFRAMVTGFEVEKIKEEPVMEVVTPPLQPVITEPKTSEDLTEDENTDVKN